MIDAWRDQLATGDWAIAISRLAFAGLIYLFLFLVLRETARDLAAAARVMASPDGSSRRATLVVEDSASSSLRAGQALPLSSRTIIGRDGKNDIAIDDPHVSARHAEMRFERGRWWLRDLGSSNGTLLNDEPVRTVVAVRHGDVLQCGRVRFRFDLSTAVPFETATA